MRRLLAQLRALSESVLIPNLERGSNEFYQADGRLRPKYQWHREGLGRLSALAARITVVGGVLPPSSDRVLQTRTTVIAVAATARSAFHSRVRWSAIRGLTLSFAGLLRLSLPAVAFVAACSSATEPLDNPSPAGLAGAFAITQPIALDNGATVLADTLILGADRSVVRHRVGRVPGPDEAFWSEDIGDYSVSGQSIVLRFICIGGMCSPNAPVTLTATAMGSLGLATRLILEEDGRATTFVRVR